MRKSIGGFTIVELLIVIVVIAILAAISIVAYTGIQDRALTSTIKSDLANFAKKIELAKVDTADGGYPTVPTAIMGIAVSKSNYMTGRWNWYYCVSPDRNSYALGVVDRRNRGYYQSSSNGVEEGIPSGLGGSSTCVKVGGTWASTAGYTWDAGTSTGTWAAWTN